MEDIVKEYHFGMDRVTLYTTYIEVSLSCTSTSVLYSMTFKYSDVVGYHPIHLVNECWIAYNKLTEILFEPEPEEY